MRSSKEGAQPCSRPRREGRWNARLEVTLEKDDEESDGAATREVRWR